VSQSVEIIDVSPRDGLQNEDTLLETETKVELIRRLLDAGVSRLEATSFVHPRLVPAMADAEAVMAALPRDRGASYIGLVLNMRGLERAIASGCDEINFVVAATDGFSRENQGMSTAEGIENWKTISAAARAANVHPSLVISTAFGCPFEGEVPVARVTEVVDACLTSIPQRLSLADTIGVATPGDVRERYAAILASVPDEIELGCHFHNTRGTGLANAAAALEIGVRSFDASLGGLGGCPFAPDATGNIASEDLIYMLHRMGYETGIDLDAMAHTAEWIAGYLPDSVVGLYHRAGPFPSSA
jgi:hydroxymethylglutaryl-CoA lyase